MGFETAGFLARIFRLRRRGHHSLLASPAVGCTRPGRTGHSPASGVGPSATTGSWFSDMRILPSFRLSGSRYPGTGSSGAGGAQAPVDDLGLVDREAVVVGRGQAGRLADRAVDVSDGTARPAHDVVMVVADPSLEPGRAAGRLDAAHQSRVGERVQGVIHGLQGDMADALAYPRGDGLDAEVVTVPDGLQQRDARGRHPQASPAQFAGGGRSRGYGHDAQTIGINPNGSRQRTVTV